MVSAGRTVLLHGEVLRLPAPDAPAPGTPVRVWLEGGFFVCATVADLELEEQVQRESEAAAARARRELLNARRAEAQAFNARIALPVPWDVGIKDVLSGLSEASNGDGRSRVTVEHILLLAPLDGRLKRAAGDFLCTAAAGSKGKRWSGAVAERAYDGEGLPFQPRVTCPACLARARHWMKS